MLDRYSVLFAIDGNILRYMSEYGFFLFHKFEWGGIFWMNGVVKLDDG